MYYDPRCFEIIDPETSYSDDVDKYFDFSESTADNTPKQSFFTATEDFMDEVRVKIEIKDFDFYQNQSLVKQEVSDEESVGMFLAFDVEDVAFEV